MLTKWSNHNRTKNKWALLDKLWATVGSGTVSTSGHWLLWLLGHRDVKIHVVRFGICSSVMPTRAEYCQSTKTITLSCSFSHSQIHNNRYTLLCVWPWPCILLWRHLCLLLCLKMEAKPREASPNAKLSCFIPHPTPHALYDWIHLWNVIQLQVQ